MCWVNMGLMCWANMGLMCCGLQAQEKLGPVDMLVNCAGSALSAKFEEVEVDRFRVSGGLWVGVWVCVCVWVCERNILDMFVLPLASVWVEGEEVWAPGSVPSLPGLAPLGLLQDKLLLRGPVLVPILDRAGHLLPEPSR